MSHPNDTPRQTELRADIDRMTTDASATAEEFALREQEAAVRLVVDLIERMEKAHKVLTDEADEILNDSQHLGDEDGSRHRRLKAKASGVSLCLSYAREALRT